MSDSPRWIARQTMGAALAVALATTVAGSAPGLDLYLSVRRAGVWSVARPLGHGINSEAWDFNPSVSPDGRTFFFTSARSHLAEPPSKPMNYDQLMRTLNGPGNGLGDIYSIPIEALEIPR